MERTPRKRRAFQQVAVYQVLTLDIAYNKTLKKDSRMFSSYSSQERKKENRAKGLGGRGSNERREGMKFSYLKRNDLRKHELKLVENQVKVNEARTTGVCSLYLSGVCTRA